MGFYDANPQIKNEFAQAESANPNGASGGGSPSVSAIPDQFQKAAFEGQSGMSLNTGADGKMFSGNTDPSTDPSYQAMYGGGQKINPTGLKYAAEGMAGISPTGNNYFEDGGAVEGDDETENNDPMSAALNMVEQAFQYGRQKHGIQTASNMPATPGTQSTEGIRTLPMPGPLPPTANPFGKRPNSMPAGKTAGDVVPMQPGFNAKGAAGQYKNWGRDKNKEDDNSNVRPMPQPTQQAIPDEDDEQREVA